MRELRVYTGKNITTSCPTCIMLEIVDLYEVYGGNPVGPREAKS